ncbi:Protein kinase [Mycena indigotica]|uniref:non-specific serine/threonine protein kinase n=1 Tax=Mycena indigotica TaxID=2126181 RepID=A0A8H6SY35_9AGAR|nr:Protein kinase [Mycena indigotica]KAF7307275.1 Protein kinase [Mycena indigotica]
MVFFENLLNYKPGGLHPVHIGDTFAEGRYEVIDKLGHGCSSTIWLVRDSTTANYVSLKIIEACRSESPSEFAVLKHLEATYDAEDEGSQYVVRMLDHFVHEGPNGAHLCIVQELLGPSLTLDLERFYDSALPSETASRLVGQLVLAVDYLHKRGVAHGDLHTGNILLCIPSTLNFDFGSPITDNRRLPTTPTPHMPKYLVIPLVRRFTNSFIWSCMLKPQIKLCDFSESYMASMTTPPRLACPHILRPPEGILTQLPHATLALDIWALAVVMYQILTNGELLFFQFDDYILEAITLTLGKFPEPLWSSWSNRAEFFDDDGNPVHRPGQSDTASMTSLSEKAEGRTDDKQENAALAAMLEMMLRYDAESRSSSSDLVQCEWIVEYCRPYMGDDVILPEERTKVVYLTEKESCARNT